MHNAASWGHVETMETLAALAPETLSARTLWGDTPMHKAALHGRVEAIEFLAELVPQTLVAVTKYNDTPMHKAATRLIGPVTPRHVATLEVLARLASETALAPDNLGRTPLDLANGLRCGHVIAARVRLTESQWDSMRCPAEELEKLLPVVLRRSKVEAGWLAKRLSEDARKRVQAVLLAAYRLGLPTGLQDSWLDWS